MNPTSVPRPDSPRPQLHPLSRPPRPSFYSSPQTDSARRTDPLGWRAFSDVDSELDRPVPEVPPEGVGDPGPQVMGHSGYQHTAVYRRQIHHWTGEPFVPDPTGTRDLTTLPPI